MLNGSKAILTSFTFYFLLLNFSYSQRGIIDSLLLRIESGKYDSSKIQDLCNLCDAFQSSGRYDSAITYCMLALEESHRLNNPASTAEVCNLIGIIYRKKADFSKSLEFFIRSLHIREEILEKKLSLNSSMNDEQEKKLRMGIGSSYNNIGNIYSQMSNPDKALENYTACLGIMAELGHKKGIATSFNNIGNIYSLKKYYEKALENYSAALSIRKEIHDAPGIASTYNNIALAYVVLRQYDKALENHLNSLKIKEETGDKAGLATSYNNIGEVFFKMRKAEEAKKYSLTSLAIARDIGSKDDIQLAYLLLSRCDSVTGNWKSAYEHHQLFSGYKDSIFNEESSRQMAEMETLYETEKKEKEIAVQKAEITKKEAMIRQQNIQRIALVSGLVMMIALAFVIYRAYRNKQKSNLLITAQKNKVEIQKKIIEEKNQNITDSIEYASYIQKAVLPMDEEFKHLFPDSFILYRPKDIVSGDFYWCASVGTPDVERKHVETLPSLTGGKHATSLHAINTMRLLACCDCTGHGVPGAFMSMLCTALLNEAVNDKGLTKPNEIFEEVRKGIISALKQRTGQPASSHAYRQAGGPTGNTKDGMDATIIALEYGNAETRHASSLRIACANNPVYIIHNGSLAEIPPDRFPVGVYEGEQKSFYLHEIELIKGDMIYTATDGFEDQLGGEKGKKFKSAKFKELLITISSAPVGEQKVILEKTFEEWKGTGEQTDDMTVIGIRV